MKVALLQMNPVVGDVSGNAARLARAVRRAASLGADLCLAPELALLGYPPRDLLLFRDLARAGWRAVEALARIFADGPALILGAAAPAPDGRTLRNRAAVLARGRVLATYDKRLLPSYDVFDETRYFSPGQKPVLVRAGDLLPEGRPCPGLAPDTLIGLTVCEDIWNDPDCGPEAGRYACEPVEELARAGARVVVNVSASPFQAGKQRLRQDLLSGLARKHRVALLYVNQVGGNDELVFDGRSSAHAPDGVLAARARGFDEDLLLVEVAEEGWQAPGPGDQAPAPGPRTLRVSGTVAGDDFALESEAWRAMVLGTRDYCRKCGFATVLLGLSGGVDSSLVAAVAAEALGPQNVTGVLMPSPHSSRGSVDDALALAAALHIRTETIPISPLMEAFGQALAEPFAGAAPDVTEENIQSRIRGNLLMALSNKRCSLLLTTGNKSELAVGYCTIYGDMCGGLAVIADLPKTLVYRVCAWLNASRGGVIPREVLDKAPSAELAPGQKDQDSLPPYDVLDAILVRLIEQGASPAAVAREGFDPETVERVWRLVRFSEFKRRQAAPGLKITSRAFGMGWRMPLACRPDLPMPAKPPAPLPAGFPAPEPSAATPPPAAATPPPARPGEASGPAARAAARYTASPASPAAQARAAVSAHFQAQGAASPAQGAAFLSAPPGPRPGPGTLPPPPPSPAPPSPTPDAGALLPPPVRPQEAAPRPADREPGGMVPDALRQLKSEEDFMAHAGFFLDLADGDERQALVKISSHQRGDGSGYAVFTFLFDTGGDAGLHRRLRRRFQALTDNALSPELGPDFQFADRLGTGPEESLDWHMQDLYVHYRHIADLRTKVEQMALPGLARILGGRFEDLVWWRDAPDQPPASTQPDAGITGFLARLALLMGG